MKLRTIFPTEKPESLWNFGCILHSNFTLSIFEPKTSVKKFTFQELSDIIDERRDDSVVINAERGWFWEDSLERDNFAAKSEAYLRKCV